VCGICGGQSSNGAGFLPVLLFPLLHTRPSSGAGTTGQIVFAQSHPTPRIRELLCLLKLIYDRQSVGQSVLVPGTHLGPATNFSFSLKFPSDSCVFVIL
jgi:hypothetical protein